MVDADKIRIYYGQYKKELDENQQFEECELFKKIKIENNEWDDDDIKFEIFLLRLKMLEYISHNNFDKIYDYNSDAFFGLDMLS